MRLLSSIDQLAEIEGPIYLAIGVFDGVHLGHKAVIRRAVEDAGLKGGNAVVVSFDPHPIRILRPAQAPRLLTSTPHKIRLIRDLGASHLLMIPFNEEFAATPAESFVQQLHRACRPLREICVGHQWSFGNAREGNLDLLKSMGDQLGFDEIGIPAVEVNGKAVSSTSIRSAVEQGDLKTAKTLLGRPYSVYGTVIEGEHLGSRIGFPTANLSTHNEQFPPDGVYAVEALHDGRSIRGIVNIGVRPTVSAAGGARLLEAHLFDFDRSIYGENLEVFFGEYLRTESKFTSIEMLKEQIVRDCEQARNTRPIFSR